MRLAVPPEELSILDVFTAIEQKRPLFQTNIQMRATGEKPTRAQETIQQVLRSAEAAMKSSLQLTTINDLLKIINN